MLKKHEQTFSLLQKVLDCMFIVFAWFLAYIVRFDFLSGGQPNLELLFVKLTPIITIITLYYLNQNGLYRSQRFSSRYREINSLFTANLKSFVVFVIILYFFAPGRISRIALGNYFVLSTVMLIFVRISARNYLRHLRRNGRNLRNLLLIGNSKQLLNYIDSVRKFKDAGIKFIGWLDSEGMADKEGIPSLSGDDTEADGELKFNLMEIKKKYKPDVIVLAKNSTNSGRIESIIRDNYNDLVPLQVLPDLSYSFIGHEIEEFAGIPLLTVNQPKLTSKDTILKRFFDIVFSFLGLIILSPLLALIAILVKATSKGPILYGQVRVGIEGELFTMWKFRSMKVDAETRTGAVWAIKDDPRKTPIGSFLRASSLDELPQIWNVLIGNMSLVGPRPERPVFVEKFKNQIPGYMLRHKVKAGLTGWAQVNGWRGDTSLEKRIEFDIYYIKNWSLFLDVKIILLTFWKGLVNKNAY